MKPATLIFKAIPFLLCCNLHARLTQDFDNDWLFKKDDAAAGMMSNLEDQNWAKVTLPHDWSSDGPFAADYASSTGYAPGGIAWYRKHFSVGPETAGKIVTIEFDGIYEYSEVWLNGQFIGGRPYGYSSFQLPLTPLLKPGDNLIAVRVDHSRFADSRYYTGSGIYRDVRLVVTDPLHVAHWGTYVTTPKIQNDSATVRVETTVANELSGDKKFSIESGIITPTGSVVAKTATTLGVAANTSKVVVQELKLSNPRLWSPSSPVLYSLRTRIVAGTNTVDETATSFGVRSATFDPGKGFFLNGQSMKLKGVCLHHDAGSIGTAVPEGVLERRLRALKEIGVNAIRTSHNPPDPLLLDLCDRLGFLVMDEAFDEFTPSKNKWMNGWNFGKAARFGYAELFKQWSVTDIRDMVRRDRNHSSIILWSIGNEIDYANDPFSDPSLADRYHPENPSAKNMVTLAKPLIAEVKELDRTRPVTAAMATVKMSEAVGLTTILDADGYNYQESRYAEDHRKFPNRILYGSENGHRYDAWMAVRTNDYIAGQFLWTGADYLGEAGTWPERANGSGLLDLCSFKKPLGWFRQSLWSDQPMVYICVTDPDSKQRGFFNAVESWNGNTNETLSVFCFANCPEVELTLNGKTIGTKNSSDAVNGILHWEAAFEPGVLEALGKTNGLVVCRYAIRTAGPAKRIKLTADKTVLSSGGKDVCHVEFQIVDEHGVRVPDANADVRFELTGPATVLGIGNADLSSVEDCKSNHHHADQGRGLVILQSLKGSGPAMIKASADGLEATDLSLDVR